MESLAPFLIAKTPFLMQWILLCLGLLLCLTPISAQSPARKTITVAKVAPPPPPPPPPPANVLIQRRIFCTSAEVAAVDTTALSDLYQAYYLLPDSLRIWRARVRLNSSRWLRPQRRIVQADDLLGQCGEEQIDCTCEVFALTPDSTIVKLPILTLNGGRVQLPPYEVLGLEVVRKDNTLPPKHVADGLYLQAWDEEGALLADYYTQGGAIDFSDLPCSAARYRLEVVFKTYFTITDRIYEFDELPVLYE